MKNKKKNRKEAVKLAVKINFYLFLLLIAYYLLQIIILKGQFFAIENLLISLFCLNCVVVGLKIILRK